MRRFANSGAGQDVQLASQAYFVDSPARPYAVNVDALADSSVDSPEVEQGPDPTSSFSSRKPSQNRLYTPLTTRISSNGASMSHFVVIVPPPDLPIESIKSRNASSLGNMQASHVRRGMLLPLYPTLGGQLYAVAREFGLPSVGGLSLYLCDDGSGSGGPRIGDATWSALWSGFFEDTEVTHDESHDMENRSAPLPYSRSRTASGLAASASTNNISRAAIPRVPSTSSIGNQSNSSAASFVLETGRLPIVGRFEWAVDVRRAKWWRSYVGEDDGEREDQKAEPESRRSSLPRPLRLNSRSSTRDEAPSSDPQSTPFSPPTSATTANEFADEPRERGVDAVRAAAPLQQKQTRPELPEPAQQQQNTQKDAAEDAGNPSVVVTGQDPTAAQSSNDELARGSEQTDAERKPFHPVSDSLASLSAAASRFFGGGGSDHKRAASTSAAMHPTTLSVPAGRNYSAEDSDKPHTPNEPQVPVETLRQRLSATEHHDRSYRRHMPRASVEVPGSVRNASARISAVIGAENAPVPPSPSTSQNATPSKARPGSTGPPRSSVTSTENMMEGYEPLGGESDVNEEPHVPEPQWRKLAGIPPRSPGMPSAQHTSRHKAATSDLTGQRINLSDDRGAQQIPDVPQRPQTASAARRAHMSRPSLRSPIVLGQSLPDVDNDHRDGGAAELARIRSITRKQSSHLKRANDLIDTKIDSDSLKRQSSLEFDNTLGDLQRALELLSPGQVSRVAQQSRDDRSPKPRWFFRTRIGEEAQDEDKEAPDQDDSNASVPMPPEHVFGQFHGPGVVDSRAIEQQSFDAMPPPAFPANTGRSLRPVSEKTAPSNRGSDLLASRPPSDLPAGELAGPDYYDNDTTPAYVNMGLADMSTTSTVIDKANMDDTFQPTHPSGNSQTPAGASWSVFSNRLSQDQWSQDSRRMSQSLGTIDGTPRTERQTQDMAPPPPLPPKDANENAWPTSNYPWPGNNRFSGTRSTTLSDDVQFSPNEFGNPPSTQAPTASRAPAVSANAPGPDSEAISAPPTDLVPLQEDAAAPPLNEQLGNDEPTEAAEKMERTPLAEDQAQVQNVPELAQPSSTLHLPHGTQTADDSVSPASVYDEQFTGVQQTYAAPQSDGHIPRAAPALNMSNAPFVPSPPIGSTEGMRFHAVEPPQQLDSMLDALNVQADHDVTPRESDWAPWATEGGSIQPGITGTAPSPNPVYGSGVGNTGIAPLVPVEPTVTPTSDLNSDALATGMASAGLPAESQWAPVTVSAPNSASIGAALPGATAGAVAMPNAGLGIPSETQGVETSPRLDMPTTPRPEDAATIDIPDEGAKSVMSPISPQMPRIGSMPDMKGQEHLSAGDKHLASPHGPRGFLSKVSPRFKWSMGRRKKSQSMDESKKAEELKKLAENTDKSKTTNSGKNPRISRTTREEPRTEQDSSRGWGMPVPFNNGNRSTSSLPLRRSDVPEDTSDRADASRRGISTLFSNRAHNSTSSDQLGSGTGALRSPPLGAGEGPESPLLTAQGRDVIPGTPPTEGPTFGDMPPGFVQAHPRDSFMRGIGLAVPDNSNSSVLPPPRFPSESWNTNMPQRPWVADVHVPEGQPRFSPPSAHSPQLVSDANGSGAQGFVPSGTFGQL